jgi:hypothetical protein
MYVCMYPPLDPIQSNLKPHTIIQSLLIESFIKNIYRHFLFEICDLVYSVFHPPRQRTSLNVNAYKQYLKCLQKVLTQIAPFLCQRLRSRENRWTGRTESILLEIPNWLRFLKFYATRTKPFPKRTTWLCVKHGSQLIIILFSLQTAQN